MAMEVPPKPRSIALKIDVYRCDRGVVRLIFCNQTAKYAVPTAVVHLLFSAVVLLFSSRRRPTDPQVTAGGVHTSLLPMLPKFRKREVCLLSPSLFPFRFTCFSSKY